MPPTLPSRTDLDEIFQDIDPQQAPLREVQVYLHTAIHKGAQATAVRFFDAYRARASGPEKADEINDVWMASLRHNRPALAHYVLPHITPPVEHWMRETLAHPALLAEMLEACPPTLSALTQAMCDTLSGVGGDPTSPARAESFALLRAQGGSPADALRVSLRREGASLDLPPQGPSSSLSVIFDNAMAWMTASETAPCQPVFQGWSWLKPEQQAAFLHHTLPEPSERPRLRL